MFADSMAFLAGQGEPPRFDPKHRPELSIAHVTSAPPIQMPFEKLLEWHYDFKRDCLGNEDTRLIEWRDHIIDDADLGVVLGLQNAPEGMSVRHVSALAFAGIRFMSLAYKDANEYGSGFVADGPLTDKGKQIIDGMAAYGINLDVSHLSNQTAIEALDYIRDRRLPIRPCASHSACRAVYDHPRNASDDVLRRIARLDGYVGIPIMSFFMVPQERLASFFDEFQKHVRHAVDVCGSDAVGIGSDGIHANMSLAESEENFERLTILIKSEGQFAEYHPDRPPELIENGEEMFLFLEDKIPNELRRRVCGLNFKWYLERALPA